MKKDLVTILFTTILSFGLVLSGCKNTVPLQSLEQNSTESLTETTPLEASEPTLSPENLLDENTAKTLQRTDVFQDGPYGRLSLSIPDNWHYETYPMDSEQLDYGLYAIRFYPKDVNTGYITLNYIDNFGVCGTGLLSENVTVAGCFAEMGTYDNHPYWDFISFQDDYCGVVALTNNVDEWWAPYATQVMEILDTLTFDASVKEGGAYIQSPTDVLESIGLYFTLKNITPTGATLVFHQYDADAPTGELIYGDNFMIEVQKDGIWEKVPVTLEGEYAFHDVGYTCTPAGTSEQKLDWTWLYGTLSSGNYRITKTILDSKSSGDFDKYTISAQFLLN